MIAYLDTSAAIPLLIDEPGSVAAGRLWDDADRVVSVRLLQVEARAALAQAHRLGRLDGRGLRAAARALDLLVAEIDHVEIDERLVQSAGELAELHALRGYDAVHLAAALSVGDAELVVVTGDRELARAASAAGLSVASTAP